MEGSEAMAAYNKFQAFVEHVAEKVHDLANDTLKVMLVNSAPVATNSVKANLTEIASTDNGYSAGGSAVNVTASEQASGTYKLVGEDVVFTQSGANAIGPFRYAVLYNDTPTSPTDPLIGFWDYGSEVTLTDGETFTVDFSAVNGILQIA